MKKPFMTKDSVFYLRKEVYDDIKDYRDDFKLVIRQREMYRIPFYHQSPQIEYRKQLVEFMKRICAEKRLSQCSLHLAVYLLDIFMDNHYILSDRITLVANVCIFLAAKIEENSGTSPKILELNAMVNGRYELRDYTNLAILMLNFFDFYIMFPTAAHYTFYFMQECICVDDLHNSDRNLRTLFFDLRDIFKDYLDRVIEDVHFMQCYKPSMIAAAVIAAGRLKAGLKAWTEQLSDLTQYKEEDLKNIMDILLS